MNRKKILRFVVCSVALSASTLVKGQRMDKLIKEDMQLAARQYKLLAANTPQDSMPRHYNPTLNVRVNSDTKWWTSGFFPGSLWLIYEYTKDEAIRSEADRRLAI